MRLVWHRVFQTGGSYFSTLRFSLLSVVKRLYLLEAFLLYLIRSALCSDLLLTALLSYFHIRVGTEIHFVVSKPPSDSWWDRGWLRCEGESGNRFKKKVLQSVVYHWSIVKVTLRSANLAEDPLKDPPRKSQRTPRTTLRSSSLTEHHF